MSTHAVLPAPLVRAAHVISRVPVEVRTVLGSLAFLAIAVGALSTDWRLGTALVVTIGTAVVLRINAAMQSGSQEAADPEAIDRLLRENEAMHPAELTGLESGWAHLARSARALRTRTTSRPAVAEPTGPQLAGAPTAL